MQMRIKIGDEVEASMDGKTWHSGIFKKESEIFAQYGVYVPAFKEVRYFIHIRKPLRVSTRKMKSNVLENAARNCDHNKAE